MDNIIKEDEIVDDLITKMSVDDIIKFSAEEEKNLISYHHGLGRYIRNTYKLWGNKWEPQIVNNVDVSPDHPDAISMRIIEKLHKKLSTQQPENF